MTFIVERYHEKKNPLRHNGAQLEEAFFLYLGQIFDWQPYGKVFPMDVLLNGLSISVKGELQSLCCIMGKTMSFRCHFLAANGWRLIE